MTLNLKKPIVFFDIETTGLDVGKSKIVEISMLKITADNKKQTYTQRINPVEQISQEAYSVHGISNEDVKLCPTFTEVAKDVLAFIGNADLAGYNILHFDLPLLAEEFLRANIVLDVAKRNTIDVKNIFFKMEPRTLSAAYGFYCNKNLDNAHSAEADTLATYEILLAQIEKYKDTPFEENDEKTYPVVNDVNSLSKFSVQKRFVDLAGHIVLNDDDIPVFNFGKHKRKSVVDVIKKEPQYYDWIMKSDFPEYTKRMLNKIVMENINKQ